MPGKKKVVDGGLGRMILKKTQREKRERRQISSTGFHVADLEQSNNPLQSITLLSSLEDFVAGAVSKATGPVDDHGTSPRSHYRCITEPLCCRSCLSVHLLLSVCSSRLFLTTLPPHRLGGRQQTSKRSLGHTCLHISQSVSPALAVAAWLTLPAV